MIRVITNNKSLVEKYLESVFSFEKGLITLYIGWELAKENGASILNKKINESTYWTFLPTEKRKIFEEDLKTVKDILINKIKEKIIFNNLDPLKYKTNEDFYHFLITNFSDSIGYLYKRSIYFYLDKKVYHLDLELLDFMSWDIIDNVKKKIKTQQVDKVGELDVKYIPYLIDAKENNIISDFC